MLRHLDEHPRFLCGGIKGIESPLLRVEDRAGLPARVQDAGAVVLVDVLDLARGQRDQVDVSLRRDHDHLGPAGRERILGEIEALLAAIGRELHDAVTGVRIDPFAREILRSGGHGEACGGRQE
jgi:hypothetical protein